MDISKIKGHGAMMGAEVMWGAGAPLGKFILAGSVSPLLLTDCRIIGTAALFWLLSLFTPSEHVSPKDLLLIFFASLLGIVFNQCLFLFGLSYTSPINASIITTSLPIVTMVMAAIFLREPVTKLKVGGVFLGAIGALILIVSGTAATGTGSALGDGMVLLAQISFSCYLVFFKRLTAKYRPVTLMKWMFTYASICIVPFSYGEWAAAAQTDITATEWWAVAAFVLGPTFLSYLLLPVGQKNLRPTVTSMYNYVQPIVASIVAVWVGMDRFTPGKAVAVVLVFVGVFLVSKSKSRADMQREARQNKKK